MRNLKRALSLALAAVMVLSMMVIGAGAVNLDDFSDKDEIVNKEAVTVLTTLNVINGKDDGSYDPTGIVTRAEMAKIICVILNGGSDPALGASTTHTYTDTVNHWAEAYIEYCTQLGIVAGKGNGTFDPNGTVTATEAAKMLLVALGYNASFENMVGANWAVSTNVLANQNKLYAGLAIDVDAGLTRDNAAQMAYNALNCEMVEYNYALVTGPDGSLTSIPTVDKKDDTLLSDKFGGVRVEGVVLKNEQTANNFDGKTRIDITNEDELTKVGHNFGDTATFEVSTDASILGTSVFFYAVPSVASPTNAEKALVLGSVMDSGKNVIVTNTDSFDKDESNAGNALTAAVINDYMDDEDIDVNDATVVFVNGSMDTVPNNGSIAALLASKLGNKVGYETKFIDNDNDGVTEAVVQTQYSFGKVIRYNSDEKDGGLTIDTDPTTKDVKADKIVGLADVALNDYVNYYEMGSKLYVSKAETLTGTIESVKENGNRLKANLTVDGTTYTFTTDVYTMDGVLEDPDNFVASEFVGKEITLYLDPFGYVAASSNVNGYTDYAYIANGSDTNLGTGLAGSVTVYAVLPDGSAKSYTVANLKNGTFDGKPSTYVADDEYTVGDPAANVGTVYGDQLYGYYINSKGEIELTVPTTGYQDVVTSAAGGDNASISFKKGQSTIYATGLANNLVDSDTVFYYVFMKNGVVDHIDSYIGKDNAPSVDIDAGNTVGSVATINKETNGIAEAVVFTTNNVTSGSILYLYQYVRTTGDYKVYNAVIDGELVKDVVVDSSVSNVNDLLGVWSYTVNGDNVYSLQTANTVKTGYVKVIDGTSLVVTVPGDRDYQLTLNSETSMAEIDGADTAIISGVTKDSWVTVVYDSMSGDNTVKGLYLMERYAVDNASVLGVKIGAVSDVAKSGSGYATSYTSTATVKNDLAFSKSVNGTPVISATKPTTYAAAVACTDVTTMSAGKTYYIVTLAKDGASFGVTELTVTAASEATADVTALTVDSTTATVSNDNVLAGTAVVTGIVGDKLTFSATKTAAQTVVIKVGGTEVPADGYALTQGDFTTGTITVTWTVTEDGHTPTNGSKTVALTQTKATAPSEITLSVARGGSLDQSDLLTHSSVALTGATASTSELQLVVTAASADGIKVSTTTTGDGTTVTDKTLTSGDSAQTIYTLGAGDNSKSVTITITVSQDNYDDWTGTYTVSLATA